MAQLTGDTNDQFAAMAMHRYCLGRKSYAAGIAIDWLCDHWGQLLPSTQLTILRDTIEELARGSDCQYPLAYFKKWEMFVELHLPEHASEGHSLLAAMVEHDAGRAKYLGNLMARQINNQLAS